MNLFTFKKYKNKLHLYAFLLNLKVALIKDPAPKIYICKAKRNFSNTEQSMHFF